MTRNFLIFALSIRKIFQRSVAGIYLRHKSNVFHVGEKKLGEGKVGISRVERSNNPFDPLAKIRPLLLEDGAVKKHRDEGNVNTKEGNVGGEMTQLQLHTKAISGSAFATRGLDSEKEQRPGDAASDGRFRYEAERTREQSREREREKWIGTVADEGENDRKRLFPSFSGYYII